MRHTTKSWSDSGGTSTKVLNGSPRPLRHGVELRGTLLVLRGQALVQASDGAHGAGEQGVERPMLFTSSHSVRAELVEA
ncbi:MAG: hypothetical protein ACRC2U_10380 [Aeromonas sp.]